MGRKIIIGICLVVLLMGLAGYFTGSFFTPKVGVCYKNTAPAGEKTDASLAGKLVLAGYTVVAKEAGGSGETQLQQVRALLAEDANVILLEPVDDATMAEALQMAVETPVIIMGQEPENLGNAYFVGSNKVVPAGMQAQLLTAVFDTIDINGDKAIRYMVLTDAEDYYRQTLEEREPNTAQRLELFECKTGEEAKSLCMSAFTKYGRDLELIICSSDALALGAAAAIRENGRIPGEDVLVMGAGATEEGLAAVQNGYVLCTVGEDTQGIYNRLLQTVQKLVKSTPVNQKNYVNHKLYLAED